MAAKVFISYRRDDSAGHAGCVRDRLERELGHNLLFMDVDAIPLGTNFSKVLHEEVAKCGVLLAVIGPNWSDGRDGEGKRRLDDPNDFVRIEVAAALHRDIPVIPILLDGSKIPKASELPDDLKELAIRNGLDVRHASFHQDMDRLIGALKKQLGQAGGPKRVDLVEESVSELIGATARGTQSHVRTLQGGMSSGGSCVTSTISRFWGGSEAGWLLRRRAFGRPLSISFLRRKLQRRYLSTSRQTVVASP